MFYERYGHSIDERELRKALKVLRGAALDGKRERKLWVRVGGDEERILYDLGHGRAVEMTKGGWRIVQLEEAFFKRSKTAREVRVEEADPEEAKVFLDLLPIEAEDGCLLLATLGAAFIPFIAHPAIILIGREGSGKSWSTRAIVELIDPQQGELLSIPKSEEDAVIAAHRRWVVAFDNISRVPSWFSDFLARLVTGEGFSKRRLYTDRDEEHIALRGRIAVLNGIDTPPLGMDALDRCLIFKVKVGERKEERELERELEEMLPRVRGALLAAVAKAMSIIDAVRQEMKEARKKLPRLADFVIWGEALARAFGYPPFEFYEKFTKRMPEGKMGAIEGDELGMALIEFMQEREEWRGTPSELLGELRAIQPSLQVVNPISLGRRLRRIEGTLESLGLIIRREKTSGGMRVITLSWQQHQEGRHHHTVMADNKSREEEKAREGTIVPSCMNREGDGYPYVDGHSGMTGNTLVCEEEKKKKKKKKEEPATPAQPAQIALSPENRQETHPLNLPQPATPTTSRVCQDCGKRFSTQEEFLRPLPFCEEFQERQTREAAERMKVEMYQDEEVVKYDPA